MNDSNAMRKAFDYCYEGIDEPDCIIFPGYEAYVSHCNYFGIQPLLEEDLLELVEKH